MTDIPDIVYLAVVAATRRLAPQLACKLPKKSYRRWFERVSSEATLLPSGAGTKSSIVGKLRRPFLDERRDRFLMLSRLGRDGLHRRGQLEQRVESQMAALPHQTL